MTDNTIQELAQQYIDSSGQSLGDEISSLKETIENLKEEKKEYEGLSEDDPVIKEIKEEIQQKQDELEDLKEEQDNSESLEQDFLESVWNQLSFSDIDETVAQAINLALVGEKENCIRVKGHKIPAESGEVTGKEARKCAYQIKMLVKDKLQGNESVQDMWDSFGSSVKYEPFKHVASSGEGMSPKEVADKMGVERDTVQSRMSNPRHHQPMNPYHVEEGTYKLSIVGEYLWNSYASRDVEIDGEPEQKDEEAATSEDDGKKGEDFWDEFSSG